MVKIGEYRAVNLIARQDTSSLVGYFIKVIV